MEEAAKKVTARYDGLLTISTGSSRKTRTWKQKKIAWSQLVQMLGHTKRTSEKQADYFKMEKEQQDEIKDVGGFVGGTLKEGRRTALSCGNRQIVTLDADYADVGIWETIEMFFGDYAICCYSTHKHTREKPRLRLVIPLSRPVTPDEYQAVSRKIADNIGIDSFDDSTYQPHRLMYWPSSSIDAEFFFRWQDGPWLSADDILNTYDDWHDQTSWPTSSRVDLQVKHSMKKQQDPYEKKGLIGVFCRAYTITEVMEKYLPGVYGPVEGKEGRFTFLAGTSSGGALTYDDKWLYSFHSTDPCSNQLVNAFDLVRIHKFSDIDGNRNTDDPTKLPSYSAMMDIVKEDEKVKVLQITERRKEMHATFEDLGDEEDDEDVSSENLKWASRLKVDKTGKILPMRANIRLILENDPGIQRTFGWDAFSMRIAILRNPTWRKDEERGEYWEDSDDAELRYFMETNYQIDNKMKLEDEILSTAMRNSFHKVRDYLKSLTWDGTERIEKLFIDYLGAEDTEYTRAVTRKTLVAAVGRVMKPGLKFDNMLVLQGRQGIGKSMILKKLGKQWFSDSLDAMQGKEAYEQLRGCWIIEIGELAALNKSEVEATKKFISKQTDTYRVAYGRRTQDFPRQCIFIGTTNEATFLKDRTGNRRFWPIRVGIEEPVGHPWDLDFEDIVDQIWAEALEYWKRGESVWLGGAMERTAEKIQTRHMEDNPLEGAIRAFLEREVPSNWYSLDLQTRRDFIRGDGFEIDMEGAFKRTKICPVEIWCEMMGGDLKRFGYYDRKDIRDVLDHMEDWELYRDGYVQLSFGRLYGQQRTYVRKGTPEMKPGQRNDLVNTKKKQD